MLKDENYIQISGWMLNKLNLKGNELLVYAIIYSFSQDGKSKFTGSLQYLADWTNSTPQGVLKAIKGLLQKELIKKSETKNGCVKLCSYSVDETKFNGTIKQSLMDDETKFNGTIKQSLMDDETKFNGTIKQSLMNNTIDIQDDNTNLNNNSKSSKYVCKESIELCEKFLNYCKNENPHFTTTKKDKCTEDIGKIHFIDGYSWDDIRKVIDFAKTDHFWKANILSGDKLRKQMQRLYLQASNKNQNTTGWQNSNVYQSNQEEKSCL